MCDRFKFRVWDKSENKMYNDLYDAPYDMEVSCINDVFQNYLSDDNNIIMQCTGLRDLSDRLIYEGDIIEFDLSDPPNGGHNKGYVCWEEHNNQLVGWWINDLKNEGGWDIRQIAHPVNPYTWSKIIGNIHENPQMLEFENV